MDEIIAFFVELLFEVPLNFAMGSKRLKTKVKTTIYCVLSGLFCGAAVALSVLAWLYWPWYGAAIVTLLTLLLIFYCVIRGKRGHKQNWKNW